jgi:reverse transcriptase-like protein
MLAVIRALEEWRAELEGLQWKDRFSIYTDHWALEYFMSTKKLNDEDHQPDNQEKVSEPPRRQPQRQRQLPERYRQNVVDLAVFLEDTDITGNCPTSPLG